MTRSLLLVSLAAGSLTAPMPASSAATELAIRAITVRPAAPVVGAHDSVSLVIDVIARGARGKNGVTVKVEPGAPPGPLLSAKPPLEEAPSTSGSAPIIRNPAFPDPGVPGSTLPGAALPGPPLRDPANAADPDAAAPGAAEPQAVPLAGEPSPAPTPAAQQPAAPMTPPQGTVQLEGRQNAQPGPHPLTVAASPKVGLMEAPASAALPPRLVWRQAAPPAARMTADWQTWRFLPDKKLNRFYPTGTWTITATARGANGATVTEYASFQLRRATNLTSIRVERSPKSAAGVRLRGSLTRIDPRGYTDFGPFGRQRLEIQWRAEGSSTWEPVAETTTDAAGSFVQTVPSRTGGHWRVRYPGTTHYAPDTTKPRQIVT
ncbi:MAG: hypothetical protein HOV86_35700 [Thermoactinospora sp.]|nr:hypothetical protein [Thermoactinospora sp.]